MKTAPLLSIGMIFKNEERCLERCLKSLQPLRDAVPCELVMADTGAEDGSRTIAEQYADEVFDFAWVDDFAAARNAVMDRCRGKWYLTIDCDEWLDADFSELLAFLKSKNRADFAFVIQRNYFSAELEQSEAFNDFRALRLVRMAAGERYHGAIHESWGFREPAARLTRTILHHDGYLFITPEASKKKTERNMKLLRKRLKEEPDSLRTLNQCIESGGRDADLTYYVRHAVEVVQTGRDHWQRYGGLIMRHAVEHARTREMPELNEWIDYAKTQFPGSIYTLVDINYNAFLTVYDDKEWEKAIQYGEAYREGLRTLYAQNHSKEIEADLTASTIHSGNAVAERTLLIALANAYMQAGQGEKALTLLASLEGETLSPDQVRNAVIALCKLHAETTLDATPALRSFDWTLGQNKKAASAFFCPEKSKDEKPSKRPVCTPEIGLAFIRRFAGLEAAALPLLFAPDLLREENAALLPPMHRWGLYCVWALNALDAGRPQEYLTILRRGLAACPGEKEMVQFLLDRFMEDVRPKASPELLALAERIRAILAAYNPDDPAVKAIRESDAYKQVAWIIEETPGLPVQ